ncbi:unnamed protein product [Ostreobium quekettii]|uniref:Uncharacterized protein n=1 Tax=Ostreobium quekettii TaxID=121088 RepID=A0A8S1JAQ5_9CHLO|nr:unnamed protein product [Ostreobium quekettii]
MALSFENQTWCHAQGSHKLDIGKWCGQVLFPIGMLSLASYESMGNKTCCWLMGSLGGHCSRQAVFLCTGHIQVKTSNFVNGKKGLVLRNHDNPHWIRICTKHAVHGQEVSCFPYLQRNSGILNFALSSAPAAYNVMAMAFWWRKYKYSTINCIRAACVTMFMLLL